MKAPSFNWKDFSSLPSKYIAAFLENRRLQKHSIGLYSPLRSEFFKNTPLVPGFPSLDVKLHSPGVTRPWRNFDLRFSNFDCLTTRLQSPIEDRHSKNTYVSSLRSF